ncbi:MAG: L(+)-tartrate dehydratase subunit beta [Christensenellaceae bacterium]|jgi:L(+)-tartrate dehydratase beta subunit|nr:L(+)-tartrate dehydratase subunit beta [Christensenellaceae bacterium]
MSDNIENTRNINDKKILTTPIFPEDIASLHIGDIIYLTGMLVTCRDDGHRRVIESDCMPNFNLSGMSILHAGPIIKATPSGFEMISIGPTTSRRMEMYEAEFIKRTGVKLIIGKGGMGAKTATACKQYKALHCVFPGGCAVSAATEVEEIVGVEWEDFGMPEAFWIMKVKEFGPLIVSIDTHGDNLFERNKAEFNIKKEEALKELLPFVHYSHN